MKRKLKLLVITTLLLLLSSLTLLYGQEVKKKTNPHKVENIVAINYSANKVIKKKSKQIISIRAYRKSLKIKVKTIKFC